MIPHHHYRDCYALESTDVQRNVGGADGMGRASQESGKWN
jgi:hypothetical protein